MISTSRGFIDNLIMVLASVDLAMNESQSIIAADRMSNFALNIASLHSGGMNESQSIIAADRMSNFALNIASLHCGGSFWIHLSMMPPHLLKGF